MATRNPRRGARMVHGAGRTGRPIQSAVPSSIQPDTGNWDHLPDMSTHSLNPTASESYPAVPQLHLDTPSHTQYGIPHNSWDPSLGSDALTSPTDSSIWSPSLDVDMDLKPPTYLFSDHEVLNGHHPGFQPFSIPDDRLYADGAFAPSVDSYNASESASPAPTNTIEPGKLMADTKFALPPSSSSPKSNGRSAHRRAIEEKSSVKRKTAEQKLSQTISLCTNGNYQPGLANQLNQAAELLEMYRAKIQELERENEQLNRRLKQMPSPTPYPIQTYSSARRF